VEALIVGLVLGLGLVVGDCTGPPLTTPVTSAQPTVTSTLPRGLIAFVGPDRQVWLMKPDGQHKERLTAEGEAFAPAWSPDGQTLAYIYAERKNGLRQAVLYELSSQSRHTIGISDKRLRRLSWSPNGRYLILDSGSSIVSHLALVEVATDQVIHELDAVGWAWSPDSQRLALGQIRPLETPISVEPTDSVSLAMLEINQQEVHVVFEGTSCVLYFPHSWLPDGRLLYDRLDWDENVQAGEYSRWTLILNERVSDPQPARNIPLAFDQQAILARLPVEFQDNTSTHSFSWSADGRWVVFQAGGWPEWGIYLFDWEEGGQPRRLADGTSPIWQPVLSQ